MTEPIPEPNPLGGNGVDDLAEVPDYVDDAPVDPTPLDEDTSERDPADLADVLYVIEQLPDDGGDS